MRALPLFIATESQGFRKSQLNLTPNRKGVQILNGIQILKRIQILKGETIHLLGNSTWIRLLFRNEVRIQIGFHKLHQTFISSLSLQFSTSVKILQNWAELQRTPIYHLAKSTHVLGEVDTRSRLWALRAKSAHDLDLANRLNLFLQTNCQQGVLYQVSNIANLIFVNFTLRVGNVE